jgi:tetratricopeptide (TPR) repeat protein
MFDFIIKKIAKKDANSQKKGSQIGRKFRENSKKASELLDTKLQFAKKEFFVIKDKCKNLQQTNYQLGLHHLEKGNLSEAVFRFRIIKKIWPEFLDAYYQMAYALFLRKKFKLAKDVLNELLAKNPSHLQAQELLSRLNQTK